MTKEQIDRWRVLLQRANRLRAHAFMFQSERLHDLASEKMQELDELVREADREATTPKPALRVTVNVAGRSFVLELGQVRP